MRARRRRLPYFPFPSVLLRFVRPLLFGSPSRRVSVQRLDLALDRGVALVAPAPAFGWWRERRRRRGRGLARARGRRGRPKILPGGDKVRVHSGVRWMTGLEKLGNRVHTRRHAHGLEPKGIAIYYHGPSRRLGVDVIFTGSRL
jgi:hypothetical protein